MNNGDQTQLDNLQSLDENARNRLLTAAVAVLENASEGEVGVRDLPSNVLAAEVKAELDKHGIAIQLEDAERIVADPSLRDEVALPFLEWVSGQPVVADEVEETNRRLDDMMVLDLTVLLGGAVLLLVLKLKRVRIRDTEIEFYEVTESVLKAVRSFISGG